MCVLANLLFYCGGLRRGSSSSRRFDKTPEDSVKKLCLVIVVVVSDHN